MTIDLAVPHYNAPEQLENFLGRATTLGFNSITVLDDASDDQAAVRRVEEKYPDVHFVHGEVNIGAGGNRNRAIGAIENTSIVTFVDVDTEIISDDIVNILRREFSEGMRRMLGGLVINRAGMPMQWNYGHEMHPVRDARLTEISLMLNTDKRDDAWRHLAKLGMDYAWLRDDMPPCRRKVDWVSEACFALPMSEFVGIGGYDTVFRHHEGQDLARRLRDEGVEVIFDPKVSVRHLAIDVRGARRKGDIDESAFLFYQKHWGMTRELFDQIKNERVE